MSNTSEKRPFGVAYAAIFWAFAFAAIHIVWASGWYLGLDPQLARAAFARPWFLAYDLAVIVLCALGGVIVLAMVRPWGQRLPRSWIGMFAGAGTLLLAVRGGLAIVQASRAAARGAFVLTPMHAWDAWFCVGAVLFGLTTWKYVSGKRGLAA